MYKTSLKGTSWRKGEGVSGDWKRERNGNALGLSLGGFAGYIYSSDDAAHILFNAGSM